jgi:hypothetical protein
VQFALVGALASEEITSGTQRGFGEQPLTCHLTRNAELELIRKLSDRKGQPMGIPCREAGFCVVNLQALSKNDLASQGLNLLRLMV